VDYVIPTHVHLDHAGGAGALMAACPNATLISHPKGTPHLIDPAKLTAGAVAVYGEDAFARDFGALQPVPEARVIADPEAAKASRRAELLKPLPPVSTAEAGRRLYAQEAFDTGG
jgi:glyoxylase-like metal-dependent hydrolase (beta-lactamase superfamily II)